MTEPSRTQEASAQAADDGRRSPRNPDAMPACPFCDQCEWMPLPDPAPARAVLSDLRIVRVPLGKRVCGRCGYACRPPLHADPTSVFRVDYQLGAAPPSPGDRARHKRYAAWIVDAVSPPPTSVLDVGCGNGGLLLALRERWHDARLSGLEPSPTAVRRARDAGLDVNLGTVEEMGPPPQLVDLAIAANVLEHAADPLLFLRALAAALRPGGTAIVICPDGATAGLELLFIDHVHSFTSFHLATMCAQAGLRSRAGPDGGPPGFQMTIGGMEATPNDAPGHSYEHRSELSVIKWRYLQRWRTLDARLSERLGDCRDVVCFGVGEAAGLLRAYAPATWARVRACTLDGEGPDEYAGLPVVALDSVRHSGRTLLLAVNPVDQRAMAERFSNDSRLEVVTWFDFVED
jgi:SAM-dependent methyltransferase